MSEPIDKLCARMREAASTATPGQWYRGIDLPNEPCVADYCVHSEGRAVVAEVQQLDNDATHIAAANPENVLRLLDELDRLRAAIHAAIIYVESSPRLRECPEGIALHKGLGAVLEQETKEAS